MKIKFEKKYEDEYFLIEWLNFKEKLIWQNN
jgi:hypothetical protein